MSENYAARPHPEHVVLEIGGELGALIVYANPEMHGREIEISRDDDPSMARSHKEVLERSLGGRPVFAAVFDQIPEGRHTLWVDDVARETGIEIAGGQVSELDWRTATRLRRPRLFGGRRSRRRPRHTHTHADGTTHSHSHDEP